MENWVLPVGIVVAGLAGFGMMAAGKKKHKVEEQSSGGTRRTRYNRNKSRRR